MAEQQFVGQPLSRVDFALLIRAASAAAWTQPRPQPLTKGRTAGAPLSAGNSTAPSVDSRDVFPYASGVNFNNGE